MRNLQILFDQLLRESDGFGKSEPRGTTLYHLFADILNKHTISHPKVISYLMNHGATCAKLLLDFLQIVSSLCVKENGKKKNDTRLLPVCTEFLSIWSILVD